MLPSMRWSTKGCRKRRGAAVVEFAIAAPLMLVIVLGMVEASQLYEVQDKLLKAAREGARIAAMGREGLIPAGQSLNDKIVRDVRLYLDAAGLPGNAATILIEDPDQPGVSLDLSDPANSLAVFQLRVRLPFSEVGPVWALRAANLTLEGTAVFRNTVLAMAE